MYRGVLLTKVVEEKQDGSGAGGTSGSSKAKHAYRTVDMTNFPSEVLASNANYFWEPLYCAERCWAASMAVKADKSNAGGGSGGDNAFGGGGGDPKKDWSPGKIRAHSIKRLRKAAKFATLLETLTATTSAATTAAAAKNKAPSSAAEEAATDEENGAADDIAAPPPADEHTRMEAKAYASWMRGNLALERNSWRTACDEYQTAFALCESLASGIKESSSSGINGDNEGNNNENLQQLELFDFFTTRARNVIAPLLKYCHYELQV